MTADERRVEPLEGSDTGPLGARDRVAHRAQSHAKLPAQTLAALADAGGDREPDEVVEDLVEGPGIERDHVGPAGQARGDRADVVVGDGADRAQRLGHDQVGLELEERSLVELVERLTATDEVAHPTVDLGGLEPLRNDAAGQGRERRGLGRMVALVGDGDDLAAEPEREQRLGRRRHQAGDSHVAEYRRAGSGRLFAWRTRT